jgi:hypothetical protein
VHWPAADTPPEKPDSGWPIDRRITDAAATRISRKASGQHPSCCLSSGSAWTILSAVRGGLAWVFEYRAVLRRTPPQCSFSNAISRRDFRSIKLICNASLALRGHPECLQTAQALSDLSRADTTSKRENLSGSAVARGHSPRSNAAYASRTDRVMDSRRHPRGLRAGPLGPGAWPYGWLAAPSPHCRGC